MRVQSVNGTANCFSAKEQKTEQGNTYKKSNIARNTGFVFGLAAAGGFVYSQARALKTIQGKRNLIEGLHESGKNLNNVAERKVRRDEAGRIVPHKKGETSAGTKTVMRGFETALAAWGAGITAASTFIGSLVDANINNSRAEEADANAEKQFVV